MLDGGGRTRFLYGNALPHGIKLPWFFDAISVVWTDDESRVHEC